MRFSAASGIAIAPILFVIAILAILATAISAATGSWSSDTAQEKARTYAAAIVDYASTIRAAVSRVVALGCTETQISFERSGIWVNSNAPSDKHCHIFHPLGGGIVYNPLPSELSLQKNITVTGNTRVVGIGTGKAALIMYFGKSGANNLLKDVCKSINDLMLISNPSGEPQADHWTTSDASGIDPFTGTFWDASPDVIGNDGPLFARKMGGCTTDGGSNSFWAFFVLLVR